MLRIEPGNTESYGNNMAQTLTIPDHTDEGVVFEEFSKQFSS